MGAQHRDRDRIRRQSEKGVERLRTTDKKAADAYDKALETAERLADLLRHDGVLPGLAEPDMEELTIYLARNARNIERILKGKARIWPRRRRSLRPRTRSPLCGPWVNRWRDWEAGWV